jgi:hypothetical protein
MNTMQKALEAAIEQGGLACAEQRSLPMDMPVPPGAAGHGALPTYAVSNMPRSALPYSLRRGRPGKYPWGEMEAPRGDQVSVFFAPCTGTTPGACRRLIQTLINAARFYSKTRCGGQAKFQVRAHVRDGVEGALVVRVS